MEKLTGKESLIKYFYLAAMAFAMTAATACRSVENTQKKERTSMKENFTFYNIVPFANGEEKQTAADMLEYQKRTGNRIVLYSLTIHPEGYPARKKADQLFDSYRKLKKELADSDVQLGILFQSILGHWPRVDKDEEKWTRTIDIDGKTPRFCPLDPGFRKYIYEVAVTAAKEKPVFIMGDDDIRGFSPKAECFCRRHVAEFNKRTGKKFTSAQLRKAVKNSKPGDEIFEAFLQLQRDTVNGVAALIRKGIDSVDPSIPAGSCMPGWEFRFNDQTARAFAGKKHPAVMRVCNANYLEQDIKTTFPDVINRTLALRAIHKDIPYVLDEADTCPHNLYSRASISMHAKLCVSIIAGMKGAKIWYINARKTGYPVPRNYTDTLAKYQNFYQILTKEVDRSEFSGVILPCHKNFPNWHFTNTSEFFVEDTNWADTMLAVFGIPYYCDYELNQNGVYLLAGEKAVARFSDAELKKLLSGKLLVDGAAAIALTKRGFSEYLGLNAEKKEFRFNRELYSDGIRLTMGKDGNVPFITLKDKNAEVLSWYYYSPFASSAELEKISPATVFVKNSLGGHICTTGFHMGISILTLHNAGRKEWLLSILSKLNGKQLPFVVENEQNFASLTRVTKDGATLLAACNLNFEPVEKLALRCAEKPVEIRNLTPEGTWKKINFEWKNGIAILPHRMECYAFSVFKIKGSVPNKGCSLRRGKSPF